MNRGGGGVGDLVKISPHNHHWVLISHALADMKEEFFISMRNSENDHLKKRVVDLMKMDG